MAMESRLRITCDCKDTLELTELTEYQGELKKRDDSDIDKIVKSIKKYGFSFPFFVWKHDSINYCLDGHGRLLALHKLDELGFLVPPLPVVYVDCKDEQSARDLLLRLNTNYGTMTKDSVFEFIGDFEINTLDLELPCGTIDFDSEEIELPDDLKPGAKNEAVCKITFEDTESLQNFLERYKADIQEEYSCKIKTTISEV